jgi:hypothetical protein
MLSRIFGRTKKKELPKLAIDGHQVNQRDADAVLSKFFQDTFTPALKGAGTESDWLLNTQSATTALVNLGSGKYSLQVTGGNLEFAQGDVGGWWNRRKEFTLTSAEAFDKKPRIELTVSTDSGGIQRKSVTGKAQVSYLDRARSTRLSSEYDFTGTKKDANLSEAITETSPAEVLEARKASPEVVGPTDTVLLAVRSMEALERLVFSQAKVKEATPDLHL